MIRHMDGTPMKAWEGKMAGDEIKTTSEAVFVKVNDGPDYWGNMNWGKPSLAVLASNGDDGCVLFTVGPHVLFDMKESGLGNKLDDLGLSDAPAGLSVWEGTTAGGGRTFEGDYDDTYLVGTFRPLTEEEWAAVKMGDCPWDNAPWMLSPEPEPEEQCGQCGAVVLGGHGCQGVPGGFSDDDPYEGSFREAADNEGARIAAESRESGEE